MTRPESDGETPGWRIRRAKPSPTAPLLVLVALAALIAGGAGYVLGSSGNGDSATEVVAPVPTQPRVATPLPITAPPQPPPTPVAQGPTPLPAATATPNAALVATPTPGSPGSTTILNTPVPTGTPAITPGQGVYMVVAGDSLSLIAEKQNIPPGQRDAWVQALRILNGLQNDNIQPGQGLRLPPRAPS